MFLCNREFRRKQPRRYYPRHFPPTMWGVGRRVSYYDAKTYTFSLSPNPCSCLYTLTFSISNRLCKCSITVIHKCYLIYWQRDSLLHKKPGLNSVYFFVFDWDPDPGHIHIHIEHNIINMQYYLIGIQI